MVLDPVTLQNDLVRLEEIEKSSLRLVVQAILDFRDDTIFIAGRNAPSPGEEFRARLSFCKLKEKAKWRVQTIKLSPTEFFWDE